jgi:predicted amidohydrolase
MKIAVCQLLVEGGEPERNLSRAKLYIEKAMQSNVELIVLPETMDLGWTHPSVYSDSMPIPGDRSLFFSDLAMKYSVFICVGLTEKNNNQFCNTAILINPEGEIILKHRKINLLNVELPFYERGESLSIVNTSFGKIGVNICADNYYDSICLGHSLAKMGAQLIISPCAWTVDHFITEQDNPYYDKWLKPLNELATVNKIPVVTATSVGYIVGGPYEGKKMVGCSLIVEKDGVVHQGVFNEFSSSLIILDLEIESK